MTVPEVRLASAVVQGDLDKSVIRRYLKRQFAKIRYCYERTLLAHPTLEGTMVTRFTIAPSGLVGSVTAEGLGDTEVASCVASVITAIEFPRVPDGGDVQVHYPFTFRTRTVTP
ncbi:MAG: AgmX/PglI C-terminal domain-containing protein [Kofleriaceae bacterium]